MMEDETKFVLPTLSRAKLSHLLSYPVGAERISEALAATPQAGFLKLRFFSVKGSGLREVRLDSGTGYEFLRIEYLYDSVPAEKYPIWHLWPRPPQYQWEIVVQPVPRPDRYKINGFVVESALPAIKTWLEQRAGQIQRGSELLVFFYEQDTGSFVTQSISKMEPGHEQS